MQQSKSTRKPGKSSPDKLAKLNRKTGIELNEGQLGQVAGGLYGEGKKVKIDF